MKALESALLVVAEDAGTAPARHQLEQLLDLVRERLPHRAVAGGFQSLPGQLAAAVRRLATAGYAQVDVVPLTLVAAGYRSHELHRALAGRHSGVLLRYGRPLGPHPNVLADLADRLAEVVPVGRWPRTGVLLVAAGSADPAANAEVAKVARLLYEGRSMRLVDPAFLAAEPGLPVALDRLAPLGLDVVLLPYCLFGGPDLPAQQPGVVVAGPVGPSSRLAELVAERWAEIADGDSRMNCDRCAYREPVRQH